MPTRFKFMRTSIASQEKRKFIWINRAKIFFFLASVDWNNDFSSSQFACRIFNSTVFAKQIKNYSHYCKFSRSNHRRWRVARNFLLLFVSRPILLIDSLTFKFSEISVTKFLFISMPHGFFYIWFTSRLEVRKRFGEMRKTQLEEEENLLLQK